MSSKNNFKELPVETHFVSDEIDRYLKDNNFIPSPPHTPGSIGFPRLAHMKVNEYQFDSYNHLGLIGRFDIPFKFELDDRIITHHSWPKYKDGQFMTEGDDVVASIRKTLVVGKIEKITRSKKPDYGYYPVYGVRIRDKNNVAWSIMRDNGAYNRKQALKLPLAP